jgi:hypothetical protein
MMAAKKEQNARAPPVMLSANGSQEVTPKSWAEINLPAPMARGNPNKGRRARA